MADAGVEETREPGAEGSGGGGPGGDARSPEPSESSVIDAMGGTEEGEGGGSGGRDESTGDRPPARDAAAGDARRVTEEGEGGDSGGRDESSGNRTPGRDGAVGAKDLPSDVSSSGGGPDRDDELPLRDPGSETVFPPRNPEDFEEIRKQSQLQREAAEEDASEKAAEKVRKEVRRILGLDGKPDFEAESLSHVMGLARDGERVNPELEKELRGELVSLGVNLDGVKLRYESMSKEDRRQLTTFEVQQAFLSVVERVDKLATQASVSLGHRIGIFEREAKDYRKLFAGLRVLLEAHKEQFEELVLGFRKKIEEETEGFEQFVSDEKQTLTDKLKSFQTVFEGLDGHLKSCENRARVLDDKVDSLGSTLTQAEQEGQRMISDLQRVAGSGFAVRRLALLGGVIGSAAGGFFAFIVMLLLWAATSG